MSPASQHYVPILKARVAEIEALLLRPKPLSLTPYFELQKASIPGKNTDGSSKRSKSAVTDASYFLDDIVRLWGRDYYLDVSRVASHGDKHGWWGLVSHLSTLIPSSGRLIPALAETDTDTAWAAAKPLALQAGRAAMRVTMPQTNPSALAATLSNAALHVGVPMANIDVVLDWGDKMEESTILLDALEAASEAAIAGLGITHGEIITAGTPNSKSFVQAGYWTATRREWWLWLRLISGGHAVTYGDYSLYPPTDPVPAAAQYGHLRYSSGDQLHVHRKARPTTGGGLGAAYKACCVDLVGGTHFLGAGFSAADLEYHNLSAGIGEAKTPTDWRRHAATHHFALVQSQLMSPPAPPPVGTP